MPAAGTQVSFFSPALPQGDVSAGVPATCRPPSGPLPRCDRPVILLRRELHGGPNRNAIAAPNAPSLDEAGDAGGPATQPPPVAPPPAVTSSGVGRDEHSE